MPNYSPYKAPQISLLETQINNILYTREKPWQIEIATKKAWFQPAFMELASPYTDIVSLQISGDVWYVAFQEDAWMYAHPAFEQVTNKKDICIPHELKQALLENFVESCVQKLATLLDTTVSVEQSYVDLLGSKTQENTAASALPKNLPEKLPDNLHDTHYSFSFECFMPFMDTHKEATKLETLGPDKTENFDTSYRLLVDILIPKTTDGAVLLSKLEAMPTQATTLQTKNTLPQKALKSIPLEIRFEAGYVLLNNKDISRLELGDTLLPNEYYTHDSNGAQASRVKLCLGFEGNGETDNFANSVQYHSSHCKNQAFSFCSLEGHQAIVLENIQMNNVQANIQKNAEENTMPQENEQNAEDIAREENQAPEADSVSADMAEMVNDFEAIVTFELERRLLSIGEIQSIAKGYTFALGCDKGSPVTLRVNGKTMGRGRLVDMNGMLGVQVTKLGA